MMAASEILLPETRAKHGVIDCRLSPQRQDRFLPRTPSLDSSRIACGPHAYRALKPQASNAPSAGNSVTAKPLNALLFVSVSVWMPKGKLTEKAMSQP
jgi:hypothetical protein